MQVRGAWPTALRGVLGLGTLSDRFGCHLPCPNAMPPRGVTGHQSLLSAFQMYPAGHYVGSGLEVVP
jgi:hypothetical protein